VNRARVSGSHAASESRAVTVTLNVSPAVVAVGAWMPNLLTAGATVTVLVDEVINGDATVTV